MTHIIIIKTGYTPTNFEVTDGEELLVVAEEGAMMPVETLSKVSAAKSVKFVQLGKNSDENDICFELGKIVQASADSEDTIVLDTAHKKLGDFFKKHTGQKTEAPTIKKPRKPKEKTAVKEKEEEKPPVAEPVNKSVPENFMNVPEEEPAAADTEDVTIPASLKNLMKKAGIDAENPYAKAVVTGVKKSDMKFMTAMNVRTDAAALGAGKDECVKLGEFADKNYEFVKAAL